MTTEKLDGGQKHILMLIARDRDDEGWCKVSKALFQTLSANIPVELATFKMIGDAGRVRLTKAGQEVVNAMAWF